MSQTLQRSTEDEWDLIEHAREGDAAAFSEVYERYAGTIFGFVLIRTRDRTLTEEITSETFLRAFRRLESLTYRGVSVRAWLMTIARNLILDDAKSARRRYETFLPEHYDAVSSAADPAAEACGRAEAAEVRQCLAYLTDDQRECLRLRFFESLPVHEVAKIMKRNEPAVRGLQMRAVRRLGALLFPDLARP
jgi:RNA polymerase sigma-70 factor (ECF subfamily)